MSVGREFEGRDLAEALAQAAREIGLPADELRYELLEEGRRGILGMGFRPARVWVELPAEAGPSPLAAVPQTPARSAAPQATPPPPEHAAVRTMLERMLGLMGLDLTVRFRHADDGVRLELAGRDRRLLLQRDGDLLLALELVLNRMARRSWPGVTRVQLVCEGFRDRDDDGIVELAREVASQVARTGQAKQLQPLNAYQRRLVHVTVEEFPGLTSRSSGEGFLKPVTIAPAGDGDGSS